MQELIKMRLETCVYAKITSAVVLVTLYSHIS